MYKFAVSAGPKGGSLKRKQKYPNVRVGRRRRIKRARFRRGIVGKHFVSRCPAPTHKSVEKILRPPASVSLRKEYNHLPVYACERSLIFSPLCWVKSSRSTRCYIRELFLRVEGKNEGTQLGFPFRRVSLFEKFKYASVTTEVKYAHYGTLFGESRKIRGKRGYI